MALIEHLPAGAAVWNDMGVDSMWTAETHVLAYVADELAVANWQRAGGKGKQPKPLPRPADIKKKQEQDNKVYQRALAFKQRQKLNKESM